MTARNRRRTDAVAARVATLPLTDIERIQALALVARGEAIADFILAIARLFQHPPHPRHATR